MTDRRTRDYLRKYFIIHKSMPSSVTLRRLPPRGAGLKAFQMVSSRTCIFNLEEIFSLEDSNTTNHSDHRICTYIECAKLSAFSGDLLRTVAEDTWTWFRDTIYGRE